MSIISFFFPQGNNYTQKKTKLLSMLIDDESENSCSNAWFCHVVIQMSLFHIVDGEYTP